MRQKEAESIFSQCQYFVLYLYSKNMFSVLRDSTIKLKQVLLPFMTGCMCLSTCFIFFQDSFSVWKMIVSVVISQKNSAVTEYIEQHLHFFTAIYNYHEKRKKILKVIYKWGCSSKSIQKGVVFCHLRAACKPGYVDFCRPKWSCFPSHSREV